MQCQVTYFEYKNQWLIQSQMALLKYSNRRVTQEILWLFSKIATYRIQQLSCILETNLR